MYKLTIFYDEEKNVFTVDGPIRHSILCYGMLERAKDVIRAGTKKSPIEIIDSNDKAVKDLLKTVPDGTA
jgi:hypothetical protein